MGLSKAIGVFESPLPCKVRIFWEGHKIWKNLPFRIWRYSVKSNFMWKIFSNFVVFSEYPNFNIKRKNFKKYKIVTSKKSENTFTRWFMSGLFCSSKAMKARQVCSSPWDPHGGWPEYFRTSGPTIISTSGYKKEGKNIWYIKYSVRIDEIRSYFFLMIQFIFIFLFWQL